MALAERAELVARLSLDNKNFVNNARGSVGALKSMEGSMGRIAKHAGTGLKNAAANIAKIGAIGGAFIGLQVRSGIQSLATLEDAITSVDGALAQTGKGWTITGAQIAAVANQIETDTQRAFDDKDITQAATTLIRYGGIAQDQLEPAMRIMTDLAAKTGDVGSASEALAKAMADPTKATRLLRQAGVSLTKDQTKQIATWVENGQKTKAQAYLLDLVAQKTKGAAAAMHGPYNDAMKILADVTEDAQRALAEGFLPLLQRVADKLSNFLADPKNVQKIRDFGKGLADGFEKLLKVGERIPWGLIGDSLKTAGAGAKVVFDALTGLPPWIQTAVLTGWGLNKLTGGALGSIIGEGLKVTFSQFAGRGATPANPIFTKEVGLAGAGGAGGVGGAGAGILGGVVGIASFALIADGLARLPTALSTLADVINNPSPGGKVSAAQANLENAAPWLQGSLFAPLLGPMQDWLKDLKATLSPTPHGVQPKKPSSSSDIKTFGSDHNRPLRIYGKVEDQRGAVQWSKIATNTAATQAKIEAVQTAVEKNKAGIDWSEFPSKITWKPSATIQVEDRRSEDFMQTVAEKAKSAIDWMSEADRNALALTRAAARQTTRLENMKGAIDWGAQRTVAAVKSIPPAQQSVKVSTDVRVNVTANSITKSVRQSALYTANHLSAVNKGNNIGWT